MLDILFEDEHLIAIHKPCGLLVHRSKIAMDAEEFAIQLLRDQINEYVYPTHRLDRKTSGVLLFAKCSEANRQMQIEFMTQKVKKKYLSIVRGYTDDEGIIDYALKRDDGKVQDAVTNYQTLDRVEVNVPSGKFLTSRYSLVEVLPETGRMHQIRKHFAHIFHPIIGDRPHGCNKQNRLFLEQFSMNNMLLHASELSFTHPMLKQEVTIKSEARDEFQRMLEELGFKK